VGKASATAAVCIIDTSTMSVTLANQAAAARLHTSLCLSQVIARTVTVWQHHTATWCCTLIQACISVPNDDGIESLGFSGWKVSKRQLLAQTQCCNEPGLPLRRA
jgi:hypothetical protein